MRGGREGRCETWGGEGVTEGERRESGRSGMEEAAVEGEDKEKQGTQEEEGGFRRRDCGVKGGEVEWKGRGEEG